MQLPLAPSYAALCLVQGLLVAAPWRPWRLLRSRVIGLVIPLVAFVGGVALIRLVSGGAEALAGLATVAAPLLAAAVGYAWRWPAPWAYPVLSGALFLLAWRGDGLDADAATVMLVAGACLTIAALVASVAPPQAIAVALVVVAVVDAILVFGFQEVQPATQALHAVAPPSLAIPGGGSEPLPALQDATFGGALMGWMDVLAPALLATVLAGRTRARLVAAGTTLGAALLSGLLLTQVDSVPATVPVVAGLAAGLAADGRLPAVRSRLAGSRP